MVSQVRSGVVAREESSGGGQYAPECHESKNPTGVNMFPYGGGNMLRKL